MLEIFTLINDKLNAFIWGGPAMVCILGVGLYLSIRTGFLYERYRPVNKLEFIDQLLWRGSAHGFPRGEAVAAVRR